MAQNTNPVIDMFRSVGYDPYDPWGSTIEAHFQIAYTLVRHGAEVPAAWDFHPGCFVPTADDNNPENEDGDGSYIGWEFDLMMREGQVRNLIAAGNVLARYAAQLKLAGMDY